MNDKALKLSVLIPTYNRENFIKQAIDSVLNQEFSDFEIICSDNASTDKTFDILLEYAKKDSRIKVFQNKENLGPILNWKKCLDNANGEFIHWLWSDDWIEPNFYKDAFDLIGNNHNVAVSTWNYRSDNPNDINDKYLSWQFSFPSVPGHIAAKKVLMLTGELPVSPAAYILPTNLVKQHFYLDIPKLTNKLDPVKKGVGVDSLMVVGVCQNVDTLLILQKPSVVFRKHENISSQLNKDGSLVKMYLISHLWFIKTHKIGLTSSEMLLLILKVAKNFKLDFFNLKILRQLLIVSVQSVILTRKKQSNRKFISKKAVLK